MKLNEIVSAYLKELGIAPAKDRADMNARLEKTAGKRDAVALRSALEEERTHDRNYIAMSNGSLRTALEIAGIADYDYLRQACEYILQYSVAFGAKVLDIGCGSGILTCFIAKNYPGSRVTGIDRDPAAVKAATALARKLNLTNVEFVTGDSVRDLPEQFNTILCARTLRENLETPTAHESDYWFDIEAAETVGAEMVHTQCVQIAGHLAPDGIVICLEDMERDNLFYAYLCTLNRLQIGVIPQTCIQWDTETVVEDHVVQAFIAHRGTAHPEGNLYWVWATLLSRGVDMNGSMFEGYIGDIVVRNARKELLSGLNLLDDEGRVRKKIMLWSSRREQDAQTLYLQQLDISEKSRSVECYMTSTREIVAGYYDRCEKGWHKLGRKTQRFKMDENYEEIPVGEE